jgi:uncharacterized membrane protein YdfJ with MMPL/SSD domain
MVKTSFGRRIFVAVIVWVAVAAVLTLPLHAGILDNSGIKKLLGGASDSALDKLAKPDAFYSDTAVRILLPGTKGKTASKLLTMGDKIGVTTKLTKSLNDAAGIAALEAKPIFRSAVDGLSVKDVPDLALKSDGGTQYLKRTAGTELRGKVRPLVLNALNKVGAYSQLDKVSKSGSLLGLSGLNRDKLTDSVTDQALSGIYTYMAKEEAGLRANPVSTGKSILDAITK